MTLSRRARRDWRIFFWVNLTSAVISAYFGYAIAPDDHPPLRGTFTGAITSLLIATPIVLFELRSRRPGFLRRLQRLPLGVYFTAKVLFYSVVILGALGLMRWLTTTTSSFAWSVVFAVGMSAFGTVTFEMGRLLGFRTLKDMLTGRYVQPRREHKAFLLVDMKNSTGHAERLGPVRFHELLNDFFRDVADAALECEAEIHKYVGDEVILTWPKGEALADGECLRCPFVARDFIAAKAERYKRRYGVVPEFRASLHSGEIVAGEIGDVRHEIAYVGDTLNVAARLLDAAKTLGRDVLVSADMLGQAALPAGIRAEALPTLTMRGRAAPLSISALQRLAATG